MPKLLVLDISHCEKFNDCVLETLSIHCTNISELHCEGCNITDNGIIALAQHNSVIKCLTISNTDVMLYTFFFMNVYCVFRLQGKV